MNADALNEAAKLTYNTDGTVDTSTDPMNVTAPPQDRTKSTVYGYRNHQLTSITPPAGTSLHAEA